MTDHRVTLEDLAQLDAQILRAELRIAELREDLLSWQIVVNDLRAKQYRAVADYNRRAAGPLVDQ